MKTLQSRMATYMLNL